MQVWWNWNLYQYHCASPCVTGAKTLWPQVWWYRQELELVSSLSADLPCMGNLNSYIPVFNQSYPWHWMLCCVLSQCRGIDMYHVMTFDSLTFECKRGLSAQITACLYCYVIKQQLQQARERRIIKGHLYQQQADAVTRIQYQLQTINAKVKNIESNIHSMLLQSWVHPREAKVI